MARYTPTALTTTYGAVAALNANFDDIAELFEQVVFRDGRSPNAMSADFDMNHFRLKNVAPPVDPKDAVRLEDLTSYVEAEDGLGNLLQSSVGSSLVGMRDGATVQQAVAVAETPLDLLASTDSLPEGSIIRTANGFIYEVAPSAASDHHLTTAGGVKLYVERINGCVPGEAFGIVTGDWITDAPEEKVDSTVALQAALNALNSRDTLVLPSGTIYTGNVEIPFGTLAVCIVGQGTFIPSTVIQFLPGANEGFQLPHEAYEFKSIEFRGTNETGSSLFTCTRTDGLADMDWSFLDCFFTLSDHIGKLYGRGLTVDRCLIGQINDDAFILDHPPVEDFVGGSDPGGFQTFENGFRGFTIRNCRIHNFMQHLFRPTGTNAANVRGITVVGNQIDGYARIIKGHANQLLCTGNNWYIGWWSADAVIFDFASARDVTITGNMFSQGPGDRQQGNEPLIRATGNVWGLTISGNTFSRRAVPIIDINYAEAGRYVRDVSLTGNTYVDCYGSANVPLVRILGATGQVYNVRIEETVYASMAGWQAVIGDSNWVIASVRVYTRFADTVIHNLPNSVSRDNEPRTGAYLSDGLVREVFVGYKPRVVRINKFDGFHIMTKVYNVLTTQPSAITFTDTGFSLTAGSTANTSGTTYTWEAS